MTNQTLDEAYALQTDYDTFAGISEAVKTLEGFHALIKERRRAGYKRKERLREWFLFDGAVYLDTCGNAGRGKPTPIQGPVFRAEDFRAMAERLSDEVKGHGFMHYGFGGTACNYPEAGLVCPECGVPWTVENFLESYCTRESECFDGLPEGDHGKTVRAFERTRSTPECAVSVRIRRSKKDLDSADVGVIEKGDVAFVDRWSFHHPECLRLNVTVETRKKFDECLEKAGFKLRLFTPVKNEYWGYPDQSMWFKVRTELGEFQTGWRKRVISTECREGVDMASLTDDSVTKDLYVIHAWGYDKFTEYMTELRRRLKEAACRKE